MIAGQIMITHMKIQQLKHFTSKYCSENWPIKFEENEKCQNISQNQGIRRQKFSELPTLI